ncbi:tyrosine-type recombinase/integrase [Halorubrum sp. F4]|uniref:tyrosine-type recombinase/integrase n=1 Tax=Halorubrum sp. F4 TaxID=2989715 RepID=UPI002480D0DE|nr:tyrosine-type recombinase/integrase [Halorubrum sp. F4]
MSSRNKFKPLDSDHTKKFEDAAKEYKNIDFMASLVCRTLLYLGLRPNEFIHSIPAWLQREGRHLKFVITPYSEIPGHDGICTKGAGEIGKNNPDGANLHKSGNPCYTCRKHGDTNGFEGKTSNSPRTYTLNSPELEELGDDLEWFFEQHNKISFGNDGVNRRVRNVAEHAGLGEVRGYRELSTQGKVPDIAAYDLRHTFGTRLARMDFNKHEIMAMMGHGDSEMPEKYISYTGKRKENLMNEKWDPDIY